MHKDSPAPSRAPWLIAGTLGAIALAVAVFVYVDRVTPPSGHAPVVVVTGRSDATAVMSPASFADSRQQHAYEIAQKMPATLNQLYCWCHCHENTRFHHRSLLECFESDHASGCDICMGEAEIALQMVSRGTTDIRAIQEAIDARFGPNRRRT